MEKRVWTKPLAEVEQFMANNYIASECGDSGVVYNFECNAGSTSNGYNVYLADGTPYATAGDDIANGSPAKKELGGYKPCGAKHAADSDSGFLKGYMYQRNSWTGNNTGSKIEVIIWTENYTNVHCTSNLDMDAWEVLKS